MASMETKAVKINEIVEKQIPDAKGTKLSKDILSGQVGWWTHRATWGKGRLMVSQPQSGMARSFSCGTCADLCSTATVYPDDTATFGIGFTGSLGAVSFRQCLATCGQCGGTYQGPVTETPTWSSGNTSIATVHSGVHSTTASFMGMATGTTTGNVSATDEGCTERASGPLTVPKLTCTSSVSRGGSATCTVTPSGTGVSSWKFTDSSNNVVTRTTNTTSLTWSGVVVTSGTVSVTPSGGSPLTAGITANNRTNFAFTAVSPAQSAGNSLTCYDNTSETLPSPPAANSAEGFSCADQAFSFNFNIVNDNGPNNGYEYVTIASNVSGSSPTQFQFIVVTDLLSASTFYNAQCGNYSSSNSSGYIAGSQLKQNVFDHEQGSVVSHWTEYVSAQNNSSNNVGTVLESTTAPRLNRRFFRTRCRQCSDGANCTSCRSRALRRRCGQGL